MSAKIFRRVLAGLVLVMLVASGGVLTAQEPEVDQPTDAGGGLRISPVRTDLEIERGTSQEVEVFVENLSSSTMRLRAIVNDFVSDNEDGQPAIILDDDEFAPNHSLKRFVQPIGEVEVEPQERTSVLVTILIPDTAQPGGYFGAVRFIDANLEDGANVNIASTLASLILVRVPGDMNEDLSLETFEVRQAETTPRFFSSDDNLSVVMRFKNSGDVQVEPFGKVRIMRGDDVVSEFEVNDTSPRGNVLPDSVRRFEIELGEVGGLGKYTAEGNFGYGQGGDLISVSQTFYIIPRWFMLAVVGGILAIGLIILTTITRRRARRRHRAARFR